MDTEKRKSVRKKFEFPVTLCSEDGINVIEECKGVDISIVGISVKANTQIEKGTNLVVYITLHKETVTIRGTIQTSSYTTDRIIVYGIKFIDLSMLHKNYINDYINQQMLNSGEVGSVKKNDKRCETRKKSEISVVYSSEEDKTVTGEGKIIDISIGGVRFETESILMRDTVLSLQFTIYDKQLTVRGKIIGITGINWVRVYRVNFVDITDDQKQLIQEYLNAC
jgi:hypothetical protein